MSAHFSGRSIEASAFRSNGTAAYPRRQATSDGSGILPFRTSLFAAADAAIAVQPVILAYLARDGTALTPQRQREVAWIGDDDLVSGAARLARQKTLARAMFLPPSPKENDRKTLAARVRQQMLEAYAAATNRSR